MDLASKPNKSIEFYNLQTYDGQNVNSSNVVFDSGGNQFNSTITNYNNEISGLRLFFMVAPFTVIFILAVTGNLLVIATLAINRRMRNAFNAFLLNLAIADLLLGIFFMPFTLYGFIMKQFVFGSVMCKLIPYLQAVSISVSSWTLVTMSVERYYAICQPLKSKSYRQSTAHVYKVIGGVWFLSLIAMAPIAYLSELQLFGEKNKFKCRENWPSENYLIFFTYFLDVLLFVIPLFIMIISYVLIALQFLSLEKSTVMNLDTKETDGHASTQAPTTRQSSIDATYADGDTFIEGTQSQTNYSINYPDKNESPNLTRNDTRSPQHLEPNGRANHQINTALNRNSNKTRHRSTSPNSHELLSAKSSSSKPKTISFSSSLENISLDEKELVFKMHKNGLAQQTLNGDQPATPTPSIFNDEHSPVFKTLSTNSKNLEINDGKEDEDSLRSSLKTKSPAKSDAKTASNDYHLSLRRKDRNNNQERVRKPSSSTIGSVGQHVPNEHSLLNDLHPKQQSNQQTSPQQSHHHGKLDSYRSTISSNHKDKAMKLRSSVDRRLAQKRQSRVIKMLAILILEFFVAWLPLHVINLITLYKPKTYAYLGYDGLSLFFFLAYLSSCSNPITYCFMNRKFRQSFLSLFGCTKEIRTNTKQILKPKAKCSTTVEQL